MTKDSMNKLPCLQKTFSKFVAECAKHCSLCYNETQCYECTQGFYLDENAECKRKSIIHITLHVLKHNAEYLNLYY